MGCLKLTYRSTAKVPIYRNNEKPELRIVHIKKELTSEKSNKTACSEYPFGLRHEPLVNLGTDNRYLFGSKELQEDWDVIDFHNRMYDPTLGRWHSIDPLAEWGFRESPYNYVFNNPINYWDPDGQWGRTKEERKTAREERRANRQAAKMARKSGTKTIDAVSVTAKRSNIDLTHKRGPDVKFGYSYVTEGGGAWSTTWQALIWGGQVNIEGLLALFRAGNKDKNYDSKPPNATDVAEQANNINKLVNKTKSDKEILKESGGEGDGKNTNSRGQVVDKNGKPVNSPAPKNNKSKTRIVGYKTTNDTIRSFVNGEILFLPGDTTAYTIGK